MKRFFTKTGIWLLGGAAVIAVVLCIISALGSGTSLLHNALGVIASPFRSAGAAVVAWVDGIGDHFASIEDLQAENEQYRSLLAQKEIQIQTHLSDVQNLKSQICSMQSTIAEQGQEIQKLNAHIARLAESDLVLVENQKLIEANRRLWC